MRSFVGVALLVCAMLTACRDNKSGSSGGGDSHAKTVASTGQPLLVGADASDLCEHGVLPAVCPKCNPALAPVFQAKGDWCGEHGFPESFCPICHPERGGRPNADVSVREGPADGTKVRFKSKDVAKKAGIVVVKAEERALAGGLVVPARLAYDATKVAHVNARAGGVVRGLHVDVGAPVRAGQALATLESASIGADRSRLEAAQSRVSVAEKNVERLTSLHKEGLGAQKDLLTAEQELAAARAEQRSATAALSMAGAGTTSSSAAGSTYSLTTPLSGVVTQRRATIGKLVAVEELLFEVVDTSALWADLNVGEVDLVDVRAGQNVLVTLDALPNREVRGSVSYVAPEIEPQTRTGRVRVPLKNEDGVLRANMFGRARILTGGKHAVVRVPESAVQRAQSVDVVFVRRSDDVYETRHVQIGLREGGAVEITKGVRAGEEVVTAGSFLLKTETMKGSIGSGCCDND